MIDMYIFRKIGIWNGDDIVFRCNEFGDSETHLVKLYPFDLSFDNIPDLETFIAQHKESGYKI